jgi:sec-independent protein translocase protein TatB
MVLFPNGSLIMFDIGWSELLVIGVVLIVVVGPKDLPRMLRTFGKTMTQLRRMAGDFRKQFDEALSEAELDDVRESVRDLKALDPRKDLRKALDPMRAVGDEIRSSLRAATKAPEPTIPSATAPAAPAELSVVGTTEMQPMASNQAPAAATSTTPVPPAPVSPATVAPAAVEPATPAAVQPAAAPPATVQTAAVQPASPQPTPVHVNGRDTSGDAQ